MLSYLFGGAILAMVVLLSVTKLDETPETALARERERELRRA